ncbi:hypothetical protein ABPG77_008265 [Micractinium sp. CCAP 211/92]
MEQMASPQTVQAPQQLSGEAPQAQLPADGARPAAAQLHMHAGAFCDDLHNAVDFYCADGFDTLDSTLREQRGSVLTPEQQSAALHGTSQLYLALRGEVDAQLQKFETYALETCLHVPAGLLSAAAGHSNAAAPVDEAEEAAVDEQLAQLRRQIVAVKQTGRKLAAEVSRYDAALERYGASLAGLAGVVPSALGAGKENAVMEDSRALAAGAMALEGSCRQLEGLRARPGSSRLGSTTAGAPRDELAAEREILRRQAGVRAAPADSLRRVQERLAV